VALIVPPGGRKRPEHPHKLWVVSTWRGLLRVSSWPRPRGPAKTPLLQSIQQRFAQVVESLKHQHGREVAAMIDAVAQHNREVSGLNGTARVRVRDVQTKIASGTMFAFQREDGKTIWPAELAQTVSEGLDRLNAPRGALLTVQGGLWLPTPACTPGALLTAAPQGVVVGCCNPPTFEGLPVTLPSNLTAAERRVQEALSVIGQSEGDLLYRDTELWKRLPIGTTGQVLAVGADGLPYWANLADL
jgi:hypothetical protein